MYKYILPNISSKPPTSKSLQYFTISKRLRLWKSPILDGVRVLRPSLVSSIGISSGQAQMPCRQPMDVKLNCRCFHNYSFGVSYHITSQAFFTSNHITASSVNFLCLPFWHVSSFCWTHGTEFLNQSDFGQVLNQKFTLHIVILHCLPSFQLKLDTLTAARASREDQGPWKGNILSQFISKSQFQ